MSNKTSLTHSLTLCNRGVSHSRQAVSSLALVAFLATLLAPASLFSQTSFSEAQCCQSSAIPAPGGTGPAPTGESYPGQCSCCAKKPSYGFPGQIAVATMFADVGPGPLADRDLVIWNISPAYPKLNTDWSTSDARYSDPRWNYKNLGDVFGLTIDGAGNIYVAATTVYGPGRVGYLANPQTFDPKRERGQIYKIENGTGNPTPLVQLPNPNGAGLGNITWDCSHARFYVSNFDDGLIYVLDSNGKGTGKAWDHGVNLPSAVDLSGASLGLTNILGSDSIGYAKLGRRPWAVRIYQGRLYYSIWGMDQTHYTASTGSTSQNEIWSIALDSAGNFIAPARREVIVSLLAGRPYSNPVSDLSFSPTGTMFAAERSMIIGNAPSAHQSRLLEFGWTGSSWYNANPASYAVGCNATSAAGGVDIDFTPGVKFQPWATADYLHYPGAICPGGTFSDNVYGLQGFPPGKGDLTTSVLIDLNAYTGNANKTQLGEVRVPCPEPVSNSLPLI